MPRVFEIRSVEQLESYRLAWNSLWRLTRRASFTQTLDYLTAYVSQGPEVELRALFVADDEDELVGIMPLVIRTETTDAGPMRVLTYPLVADADYCGPVTNQQTVTLVAAMKYLARTPRNWDTIDLRGIDTDRVDHGRTHGALHYAELDGEILPWQRRAIVDFGSRARGQSWTAYWETRDKRFAGRIEHLQQRLLAKSEVEHVRHRPTGAMYGDDDPCDAIYDDCREIARRSWQGASPEGRTLTSPKLAPLFRDLHAAAAKCGTLDMNVLYVDGLPAAFVYNYLGGDGLTTIASGYDPRYAMHGVGTLLMRAMLRDSFTRGDGRVDLGDASHAWKMHWATGIETANRAVHQPRRALGAQVLSWGRALRKRLLNTPAV